MEGQGKESNAPEGQAIPIREVMRTAKKIFSAEIRMNKNSRYITLPKSLVKQFNMEPGDQIELAFIGFELIAAEEKSEAMKRKKQKMIIS